LVVTAEQAIERLIYMGKSNRKPAQMPNNQMVKAHEKQKAPESEDFRPDFLTPC